MQNKIIKKKEIDLSIIIPHYNTPRLLERLLDSIPAKSNIQIIVVDDNSNKEIDVLEKLICKNQNRIIFRKNRKALKGAGSCRNIGLEYATGKWLLFADADDYFEEEMYQKVKGFFDTDNDIVFFSPISINLDDGTLSHRHEIYEKRILNYIAKPTRKNLLQLKASPNNPPWSKLIKADLVRKNGIRFEEVLHANDIMFSAKIGYYSSKIEASNESIYCVTRSRGSLTTHKDIESFDIRMKEYIKVCCFLKDKYNKKDFKYLNATGIGTLYRAIRENYGMKKYFSIIREFRKNKIPLFTLETINISYIFKNIYMKEKEKKFDKKYCIK